jgi:predicted regulator of Ras-like GTPase activity (Roadblock/LC7/MglB family)
MMGDVTFAERQVGVVGDDQLPRFHQFTSVAAAVIASAGSVLSRLRAGSVNQIIVEAPVKHGGTVVGGIARRSHPR